MQLRKKVIAFPCKTKKKQKWKYIGNEKKIPSWILICLKMRFSRKIITSFSQKWTYIWIVHLTKWDGAEVEMEKEMQFKRMKILRKIQEPQWYNMQTKNPRSELTRIEDWDTIIEDIKKSISQKNIVFLLNSERIIFGTQGNLGSSASKPRQNLNYQKKGPLKKYWLKSGCTMYF